MPTRRRWQSAADSRAVGAFYNAFDQVYAFLYNVNSMRQTLSDFLTSYQNWAQLVVDNLTLSGIPYGIANQIYNDQEQIEVNLKGPSIGDFIAGLVISSVLWGLGAVLAPMLLPATAVVAATIAVGFAGSAGANALSEILGSFWFEHSQEKASCRPLLNALVM